jgi:CBS domain-containing protein
MALAPDRQAAAPDQPEALERECREVMCRDVVAVQSDASVSAVAQAFDENDVSAVIVVSSVTGKPVGWIRAGDLADRDADVMAAAESIGQTVIGIEPSASVRAARYALALPGITHLSVRDRGGDFPLGVITANEVGDPSRPIDKE